MTHLPILLFCVPSEAASATPISVKIPPRPTRRGLWTNLMSVWSRRGPLDRLYGRPLFEKIRFFSLTAKFVFNPRPGILIQHRSRNYFPRRVDRATARLGTPSKRAYVANPGGDPREYLLSLEPSAINSLVVEEGSRGWLALEMALETQADVAISAAPLRCAA